MADIGASWSSRLVREKTASRMAKAAAKKAMANKALELNAALMGVKTAASRPSAVFSDSSSSGEEDAGESIAGEDMPVVPLPLRLSETAGPSGGGGVGGDKQASRSCSLLPPVPNLFPWFQLPPWMRPPDSAPAPPPAVPVRKPRFEELSPPVPGWLEVVREPASSTTLDVSPASGAKGVVTDETLAGASKRACGSLLHLDVTSCPKVTPAGVLNVCRANPRMQLVRAARGAPWGPGAITQVLAAAPELRALECDAACRRVDETIAALLTQPTLRLRQLSIIGRCGAPTVTEVLAPTLRASTLRRLLLDGASCGADGAKALAAALRRGPAGFAMSALRFLGIASCNVGAPGAKALADALRSNTTLRGLDLTFNAIGDEGAIAMARALTKDNRTLKMLVMARNGICADGGREIATMLLQNSSLELLSLADNELGAAGGKQLADALRRNRQLQQLFCQGNDLGVAGKDFVSMMRESKSLWKVELHNNNLPEGTARDLAVLALQALLRGDPGFDMDGDEEFDAVDVEVDEAEAGDASAHGSDSSGSEDGESEESDAGEPEEELDEEPEEEE